MAGAVASNGQANGLIERDVLERARGVDLLSLIRRDTTLTWAANTRGGEYAGPCPFCPSGPDENRDRLRVQPNLPGGGRWWCRHCSPNEHWQDAPAYVEQRDRCPFPEAVHKLVGGAAGVAWAPFPGPHHGARPLRPAQPPQDIQPPAWRDRAGDFSAACADRLWSSDGARARAYLHQRGLEDGTLRAWGIGYHDRDTREPAGRWGLTGAQVTLRRGITLPWVDTTGRVAAVKIRLPARGPGHQKYDAPRGSKPAVYGLDHLQQHDVLLLCEGEFDTLVAWQEAGQEAGDFLDVATLGGASSGAASGATDALLGRYLSILVALDADRAGQQGAARLVALSGRCTRLPLPDGAHDLTDFHLAGGPGAVRDWLADTYLEVSPPRVDACCVCNGEIDAYTPEGYPVCAGHATHRVFQEEE